MNNPFRKTYSPAEREKFAFLGKVKFFKHLNFEEMSRFLPAIHQRKYMQDEVVFFRNDPSQALYILEKGEVTLNIDIRKDFETIIKIKEGEPFGENSMLENSKRIYTAIVDTEEAILWVIPNYAILDIFQSNQKIKAKMMSSLATFYNSRNQQLFSSYKKSYGFFNLGQMFE